MAFWMIRTSKCFCWKKRHFDEVIFTYGVSANSVLVLKIWLLLFFLTFWFLMFWSTAFDVLINLKKTKKDFWCSDALINSWCSFWRSDFCSSDHFPFWSVLPNWSKFEFLPQSFHWLVKKLYPFWICWLMLKFFFARILKTIFML